MPLCDIIILRFIVIILYLLTEPTEVEVEMHFNSFGSLDAAHMVSCLILFNSFQL